MKKFIGIATSAVLGLGGAVLVTGPAHANDDGADARRACVSGAEYRTVKRRAASTQGIFQDEVNKVVGFKGRLVWTTGSQKVVRYRMCRTGAMKIRYVLRDIGWMAYRVRRV